MPGMLFKYFSAGFLSRRCNTQRNTLKRRKVGHKQSIVREGNIIFCVCNFGAQVDVCTVAYVHVTLVRNSFSTRTSFTLINLELLYIFDIPIDYVKS